MNIPVGSDPSCLGFNSPGSTVVGIPVGTAMCPAGILPTDIANLTQWLRSDLGITTSGGFVDVWADQSGNGFNVTGAGGSRPAYVASDATLNNLPSLTFDGVNDVLVSAVAFSSLITAAAGTIFAVGKMVVAAGGAGLVAELTTTDVRLEFDATPASRSQNNDGAIDTASVAYVLGAWKVFQWRHGGGTLYHRQTLGAEASVASGNTVSLANIERIGARAAFLNGSMAEVAIYSRELTGTEISDLLNDYFLPRYGVAIL